MALAAPIAALDDPVKRDRKSKHPHGPKAKMGRGSRPGKEGVGKGLAGSIVMGTCCDGRAGGFRRRG